MASKLILHIPHSSGNIPDKSGYVVSDDELTKEVLLLTDWHTADLFSFRNGVPVIANFNRIFCDVERFADDEHEVMSKVGMGLTYTNCDDGRELRKVSPDLKTKILSEYYYPHHQQLTSNVKDHLSLYNQAIIIDCHSFSSKPFKRDLSQGVPRPDFCVGTDDFHTPRALYKLAAVALKMLGYTVQVNIPYSGSIVPMLYYKQDRRVASVMIEVNRDLYMIPGTNEKSEGYDKVKSDINKLLATISKNHYDTAKELPLIKNNDL